MLSQPVGFPAFLPGFLATLQDERYWSDPVHVNAAGTREISRAVGAWLADRGTDRPRC